MKVKHIDHIGIAVKEIGQAGKFYTDILGLKIEDIENVADQKTNVAMIPISDSVKMHCHLCGPTSSTTRELPLFWWPSVLIFYITVKYIPMNTG